ncbi:MAG: response regulator [Gammaproteobacteria bacterium]|nr:response regulator [Gammaproteobacteria bacterium]
MKLDELLVMLVEPSKTQKRIIKRYLAQLGVTNIQSVEDGAEGLSQMEQYPPDLVISAMYLPDMTGTDLVHGMRDNPVLQDVAFLLVSSETDIRRLDSIRQAGAIAILPKPFQLVDLQRALNATLDYYSPGEAQVGDYDIENLRVMIVDDSSMARKYIRKVLANMGVERFTEAVDGSEAVGMIDQEFFDLIVTDYNMPEMDGKELTAYIRERSGQRSIPVLMVTSEQSDSRLAAVNQAGVSAICDKPFEPAMVKSLLEGFFAGE